MDDPIYNAEGERLDYTFSGGHPPSRHHEWIVVLGHGVTGDKNRPVIADTSAALNAAGFDTLRFTFAGNGNSAGDFRDATISKEVADLGAVLDVVAASYSKIVYVGHSMGAAVGVLRAAHDDRITALVSLAGMVETKTFAEVEFGNETPDHGCMWEDSDCPLSATFMTDLCETVVSVAPAAAQVRCPWFLLHGTADEVVNPQDSRVVQTLRGDAVTVVFVEDGDHGFNHPAVKAQMHSLLLDWLFQISA